MQQPENTNEQRPSPRATGGDVPDWHTAGMSYFAYPFYLRWKFGHRVQRVSVDGGFSCPNIDGTLSHKGCIFCNTVSFSPSRRNGPSASITEQIDRAIKPMMWRYNCDKFIAYFQPNTNTYADVATLERLYSEALAHSSVVGLAVATRPDCVPDEVLDLLERFAADHYVTVEFGVQSFSDRSLEWIGRGHDSTAIVDALQRSRGRGFSRCAQVILGIPGESTDDSVAMARRLGELGIEAVKIHNLYAVKDTPLGEAVAAQEVTLQTRDEYIVELVTFLEHLPPEVIIERTSGQSPPEYLIGPAWCLDKPAILKALEAEFVRRGSWQGSRFDLYLYSANKV